MLSKLLVFSCCVAVLAVQGMEIEQENKGHAATSGNSVTSKPYLEYFSKKLRNLCATLGEGAFVLGCSHEFVVCEPYGESQWHMTLFLCPNGHDSKYLSINPDNNQCDQTERIPVCQNPNTDPNVPIKINRMPLFDCTKQDDGLYAINACSQEYAQCLSRTVTMMLCPDPLMYFNEAAGACDYQENCGKVKSRAERSLA
ncbi:hypothetical protein L596_000677 [Steinernema carpocapsae]|uniref:Chitin-binding type-2 domain-containing protein n=1 Tax=Steinernema carpocapsae TaxID=34508 RepID=A0A4V6I771_STECR|nr:hypothetical protein L596_000677 [Steinernema carpocapsae]